MSVPDETRARVWARAADRCGYCLSRQKYVVGWLEIDHIVPRSRGGADRESNLWLSCAMCNRHKSDRTHAVDPTTGRTVKLFNPRRQRWSQHFEWSTDGTEIVGRMIVGRATVVALRLNNLVAVTVRREWVAAGWHPPKDIP